MAVVMSGVLAEDGSQVPFVVNQYPVGALGPDGAYPPLGIAVRPRRPRRDLDDLDASGGENLVKGAGDFASRSRMRNRNAATLSPRSISRLRACCAVQAPSGRAVTPRIWTRRVATSMANRTYSRRRKIVSTWEKSQASRPSAWVRRNARQEVSRARGAGRGFLARMIRRTVAALTCWPGRVSSPCTRRYPQAGFSRASRSTRSWLSWLVLGRPGR
jgi:hypothetical protein